MTTIEKDFEEALSHRLGIDDVYFNPKSGVLRVFCEPHQIDQVLALAVDFEIVGAKVGVAVCGSVVSFG